MGTDRARLWLLLDSNILPGFENVFCRLDSLLLEAAEQGGRGHFGGIANDEIVDVVVIDDVCDVGCLLLVALVVFLISHRRLLLLELLALIRSLELARPFHVFLVV